MSRDFQHDKHIQHSCQYVVLWTTKYGRDVITPDVRDKLIAILQEVAIGSDSRILRLRVTPDTFGCTCR